MKDLVSKRTRQMFREFLVGWTLRQIDMEFESAEISCDNDFVPATDGARRSRVEQYYNSLDFSDPSDIRLLLNAYENILLSARREHPHGSNENEYFFSQVQPLIDCLEKDGYVYENGRINPMLPELSAIVPEALNSSGLISKQTKQNIVDVLRIEEVHWAGRMTETEFLSRLYDLGNMPSNDSRFGDAYMDIYQHREKNQDGPPDWVFSDRRFRFFESSDEQFIRFLCLMVHPLSRPDTDEAVRLVELFNEHLKKDGWEIAQEDKISKKPVFSARRILSKRNLAISATKEIVEVIDTDYCYRQYSRMESAAETDPGLAIGTAKEFVETICKTILAECNQDIPRDVDVISLVKMVRKELELLPEDINDHARGAETIRKLLSNLGTIVQGLAELRSLYGTGHGKHASSKGLQPRHAHLAVGAASTLGNYLFSTYEWKKSGGQKQ